jgi:hypothetical protein
MSFVEPYKIIASQKEGLWTRHLRAACSICDRSEDLPQGNSTHMPGEVSNKRFQRLGWIVGRKRNADICPTCAGSKGVDVVVQERASLALEKGLQIVTQAADDTVDWEVWAMDQCSADRKMLPGTRSMLLLLAACSDPAGMSCLTYDQMKDKLGVNFQRCSDNLKDLIRRGLIFRESGRGKLHNTGRNTAHLTHLQRVPATPLPAVMQAAVQLAFKPIVVPIQPKQPEPKTMPDIAKDQATVDPNRGTISAIKEAFLKPALVATPPRTPTREDRRKVLDGIETAWNGTSSRYVGKWTDKSLAESLNVPSKWVEDIREEFFGPNTNDIQSENYAAIQALIEQATVLETRALALAVDAETLRATAKSALTKLDKAA